MKKVLAWLVGLIILFGVATYVIQQQQATNVVTTTVSNSESSESAETVVEESASSSVSASSESSSVSEGPVKPALNTTFEDNEGNVHELSEMFGKPIVLNIWASWCPPCKEEMPYFQTAFDKYGEDINFIMLNATMSQPTETKERVQAFIQEMNLNMPVYYDIEYNNMLKFGATVLPTTVLISSEGKVVQIIRGMVTEEQLETAISQLN